MKVCVTGGCGFIGSHLVRKLLAGSHLVSEVVVVDNLSTGKMDNLPDDDRVKFVLHDLASGSVDSLSGLLSNCKVVFHLAANASVISGVDNPESTFSDNVFGTLNVVLACAKARVSRIVYSSTCAVYEESDRMCESFVPKPANSYGLSKLMGEQAVRSSWDIFGIPSTSLRYFNVYGSGQPERGSYTSVIAAFRRCVLDGRPMTVFGDGKQTRDYVHVSDVVRANLHFAFGSEEKSGLFNIGSGVQTSVNQIAEVIKRAYDVDCSVSHLPARKGEISRACADTLLAARAGFVTAVPLEEGVRQLADQDGRE